VRYETWRLSAEDGDRILHLDVSETHKEQESASGIFHDSLGTPSCKNFLLVFSLLQSLQSRWVAMLDEVEAAVPALNAE
jgi:hypothetical protein